MSNRILARIDIERSKCDVHRARAVAFFGDNRIIRSPRVKAPGSRPICAWCGQIYGERAIRDERTQYAIGQPIQPYQGNAHLVCEEVEVGAEKGPNLTPGATVTRQTWDGVSYRAKSGHEPFCISGCALAFARAAHAAGFRRDGV